MSVTAIDKQEFQRTVRAYFAGELDANRAIDQGTRLALQVENANSGDIFERPKSFAGQMLGKMMSK